MKADLSNPQDARRYARKRVADALANAKKVVATSDRYETKLRAEGRAHALELALFWMDRTNR